jgi:WD40 repeat protein
VINYDGRCQAIDKVLNAALLRVPSASATPSAGLVQLIDGQISPFIAIQTLVYIYMAYFNGSAPAAPTSGAASSTQGELNSDIALTSPPEDSVSDLSFSKQAELLAVSSWDKKVRIYEVSPTGGSVGKAVYEHEAPVLSVHWSLV